jgi:hypothetical protein
MKLKLVTVVRRLLTRNQDFLNTDSWSGTMFCEAWLTTVPILCAHLIN